MKASVYRIDNNLPFIEDATVVQNPDGSTSFQLPDGGFAGQEPNVYGKRHDQGPGEAPKAYQRFTVEGGICTSVTRPQDKVMVYFIGKGQAYAG